MRLLEFHSDGKVSLTQDIYNNIPRYAILSHTWGAEEITFKDMTDGTGKSKAAYSKIRFCAEMARRYGWQYFWVDTCCIDKSNSTELSEAINSMFRWYRDAAKCYVYLSDVSRAAVDANDQSNKLHWETAFQNSRWFTRGWTLQELIAPTSVEFFSEDWEHLGNKVSLERQICEITGIPAQALQGRHLSNFSITERMSWAKQRQTTRAEDQTYSLLGIFNVYMPLIYGEGKDHAFKRLRDMVNRSSDVGCQFSNMYFIKSGNITNKVEILTAVGANSYIKESAESTLQSGYTNDDGKNGSFDVDGGDLYYIKTQNTGTGTIELHCTSRTTDFATFNLHAGTCFSLDDVVNGTLCVDGGDLYLISTRNTGSKLIEVHRVSQADYQVPTLHVGTTMPDTEGDKGTWTIYAGDLYFIKYRETMSSNIEVYRFPASKNYQEYIMYTTWFNVSDGANGTWNIGVNSDLYFVKQRNCESHYIEIHVATSSSDFKDVSHYASWISDDEGENGTFCFA